MNNPDEVILGLLEAMNMQVMRERDLAHIPSHSAKFIWDEKYNNGLKYLKENRINIPKELEEMWD